MNLTIEEVKRVIENQSTRDDYVRTMQLRLAEDWIELYNKLEEVENERGNSSSN